MLNLKKRIAETLAETLASMTAEPIPSADELAALLEYPPDSTMGDLALPCFHFAKVMRKAPKMIAEAIAANFDENEAAAFFLTGSDGAPMRGAIRTK